MPQIRLHFFYKAERKLIKSMDFPLQVHSIIKGHRFPEAVTAYQVMFLPPKKVALHCCFNLCSG